jgi:hypothetical protein
MAACVGVTLSLLSEPENYNDPALSARVRDAVIRELIVESEPTVGGQTPTTQIVALQLAALLRRSPPPMTTAETALLLEWLDALAVAGHDGNRR